MNDNTQNKISDFFNSFPLKTYKSKEIIVHAGDQPAGVMYLLSGEVRQYDITGSGDEVTVNVFKPPSFFPMSWAINKNTNEYFFEALTNVSIRTCPDDLAIKFIQDNSDVMYDLLGRVYKGLDGMLRQKVLLMKGSAHARVLFELVVACQRFGKPFKGGVQLNISENDLATRAGLTRETISRELQKLQKLGLITIGHKNILVNDLPALSSMLARNF